MFQGSQDPQFKKLRSTCLDQVAHHPTVTTSQGRMVMPPHDFSSITNQHTTRKREQEKENMQENGRKEKWNPNLEFMIQSKKSSNQISCSSPC